MARAQGRVGDSATKAKSSGKKKRPKQIPSKPKRRAHVEAGESTSESRTRYKKSLTKGSGTSEPSKAPAITMNSINALDVGIGIAYIVGATQISGIGGVAIAISLGVVLLLGSICSIVGYCSRSCSRAGLVGGILLGAISCLAYVGLFLWALISWNSFVTYFGYDEGDFIADKNVATIVVFAALAIFESIRVITTSITRKQILETDLQFKSGSTRSTASTASDVGSWQGFLNWFGISKKKRSDDFVMFDDNASLESALLWSKDGGQPSSDDYLEFIPGHERGLANYTSNVALPLPPEDKMDY